MTTPDQDPHPAVSSTPAHPGPGPVGPLSAPPARRRGPGWGGTIAVSLSAALLAGALAGGIALVERPSPTPAVAAASTTTTAAQQVSLTSAVGWGSVAAKVNPSVVTIEVTGAQGEGAEGTGIVLDAAGHVVTNDHVATALGAGARTQVTLWDGRLYSATVEGTDASTDLAVLTLKDPPADLVPATFGDSSKVAVGAQVMAIGNPLGLSDTVTTGIISALDRPVSTQSDSGGQSGSVQAVPAATVVTNALQTDAAINPGNSGGPLVDAAGQVIGINSSIASPSDGSGQAGSVGLGFAIPSDEVVRIATELVTTGTTTHAQLGVSLAAQAATATADGTSRQSATIAQVSAGSPAAQAGLAAGDQVVAVDAVATPGPDSLVALVRSHAPGEKVVLTVVRAGATQKITVTLAQSQS